VKKPRNSNPYSPLLDVRETNPFLLPMLAWTHATVHPEKEKSGRKVSVTWIENARPRVLFASQCFFSTYQMQNSVPGMPAINCDFVNSISTSAPRPNTHSKQLI